MPDWSRRQTLSTLAGGLAVVIAGCQGEASHESPSDDVRRVENYELERVRDEDGAALFGRTDELGPGDVSGYDHLASEERFRELTFADVPVARTLRAFSVDTDFTSQSLYLYSQRVSACNEVHLKRVEVGGTGPIARFCRERRPVDVECEADAHHTVGYAIRLPFPGDDFHSVGSEMSSTCSQSPAAGPFNGNVTLSTERGDR